MRAFTYDLRVGLVPALALVALMLCGPVRAQRDGQIFLDMAGLFGRAASNYQRSQLESRVRGLEGGGGGYERSRRSTGDVLMDARRDLMHARNPAIPAEERRSFLARAMLQEEYSRESLAGLPEFQALKAQAIQLYLEEFGSDQLKELHMAASGAPPDGELRQIYVDAFLTELAMRRDAPKREVPPLSATERGALRARLDGLRAADKPILPRVKEDPLSLTPEEAKRLDDVASLRRGLDVAYGRTDADRARSPLTAGFTSVADGEAIRAAAAAYARRTADRPEVPAATRAMYERQAKRAMLTGDPSLATAAAEVHETHHREHDGQPARTLWKTVLIGAAIGAVVLALATAPGLAALITAQALGGAVAGAFAGGLAGFLVGALIALGGGSETAGKSNDLHRRLDEARPVRAERPVIPVSGGVAATSPAVAATPGVPARPAAPAAPAGAPARTIAPAASGSGTPRPSSDDPFDDLRNRGD